MTTTQLSKKLSKKMSKLGKKGGNATKRKKGRKFFRNISLMRKHHRGGRKPSVPKPLDATIIDS